MIEIKYNDKDENHPYEWTATWHENTSDLLNKRGTINIPRNARNTSNKNMFVISESTLKTTL